MTTKNAFKITIYDGITFEGDPLPYCNIVATKGRKIVAQAVTLNSSIDDILACRKLLRERGLPLTISTSDFKIAFEKKSVSTEATQSKVATRNGWHEGEYVYENRSVFASSDPAWRTYRPTTDCNELRNSKQDNSLIKAVGKLSPHSDLLAFVVMTAFSGPLLELLGEKTGTIFYLQGNTSTGKSTLLDVALALTKPVGGRTKRDFDFTGRGLEDAAFTSNDGLLVFDEIGTNGEDALQTNLKRYVYKLANGSGKIRAQASTVQGIYPDLSWRLIGLIAGEPDVSKFADAQEISGQDVRFIRLPVPSAEDKGIFGVGKLTLNTSSADAVKSLGNAARTYNGDAYLRWLQYLVEMTDEDLSTLRRKFAKYQNTILNGKAGSVEQRIAKIFALVALTGRYLIKANIFDWGTTFPLNSVKRLYLQSRGVTTRQPIESQQFAKNLWSEALARLALEEAIRPTSKPKKNNSKSDSKKLFKLIKRDGLTILKIYKEDLPSVFKSDNWELAVRPPAILACLLTGKGRNSIYKQERITDKNGKKVSNSYLAIDLKMLNSSLFPE